MSGDGGEFLHILSEGNLREVLEERFDSKDHDGEFFSGHLYHVECNHHGEQSVEESDKVRLDGEESL